MTHQLSCLEARKVCSSSSLCLLPDPGPATQASQATLGSCVALGSCCSFQPGKPLDNLQTSPRLTSPHLTLPQSRRSSTTFLLCISSHLPSSSSSSSSCRVLRHQYHIVSQLVLFTAYNFSFPSSDLSRNPVVSSNINQSYYTVCPDSDCSDPPTCCRCAARRPRHDGILNTQAIRPRRSALSRPGRCRTLHTETRSWPMRLPRPLRLQVVLWKGSPLRRQWSGKRPR